MGNSVPSRLSSGTMDRVRDLLNLSFTKRWVVCPMYREQSVAEHTFRVMAITRALIYGLPLRTIGNGNGRMYDDAMLYAMDHDVEECFTGDVPGTWKDDTQGGDDGWPDPATLPEFQIIVKVADAIETYMWGYLFGCTLHHHPLSFQITLPLSRDLRKVLHYTGNWPELFTSVCTVMPKIFGIASDAAVRDMKGYYAKAHPDRPRGSDDSENFSAFRSRLPSSHG